MTTKPKEARWALFDKDWNYRGGLVTDGADPDPKEVGDNKAVQVKRFPHHYETWYPKKGSWVQDSQLRSRAERIGDALAGRRKGKLDIPSEQTQRWFYALLI